MKIDLSKLPEGTKWVTFDLDGDVYAFKSEPMGGQFYWAEDGELREYIGNVHD